MYRSRAQYEDNRLPQATEHADWSNTAHVSYFSYEKAKHGSDQPVAIKQHTLVLIYVLLILLKQPAYYYSTSSGRYSYTVPLQSTHDFKKHSWDPELLHRKQ